MNERKYIILVLFVFILGRRQLAVEGCHAGHQQGGEEDEEEEGLVPDEDEDEDDGEEGNDLSRRKRELRATNRDTEGIEVREKMTEILRKYFRDCMLDKVGIIWDWKSVIDFTILDTIWYLYSSSVACSEIKDTDTTDCWKTCVEVLLRENSSLVMPAKECVREYAAAFDSGKKKYTPRRQRNNYLRTNVKTEYGKCVTFTSRADDSLLFDESGMVINSRESDRDIESIVKFVRRDVKCRICDYGFLPGTQIKPHFAENIESNGPNKQGVWAGERFEYVITWPFSFEALTRRDSELRFATTFCNEEFAPTFTEDPPENLGWAEWVSWGKCIADCPNTGYRQRIRVCLDETKKGCQGKAVEQQECSNRNCAQWSEWGDWTPCISTCGVSTQISFRTCSMGIIGDVGCEGDFKRIRNCAVKSCPVPWSQWTTCSVSCGRGGVQYRRGGESLLKIRQESRECSTKTCPNEWTRWSDWGECSTSCGRGIQIRDRHCVGLTICHGQPRETRHCSRTPCTSYWGDWSQWGSCTWMKRYRLCIGGTACGGNGEEFQRCDSRHRTTLPTPIAKWGRWTEWSQCTHSCGGGARKRQRHCDSASLHSSLRYCPGRDKQTQYCGMDTCPPSVRSDSSCEDIAVWKNYCQSQSRSCEELGQLCPKSCHRCSAEVQPQS